MPCNTEVNPARLARIPFATGLVLVLLTCAGFTALRVWPAQVAAMIAQATHEANELGGTGWLLAGGVQILIALCGILPASIGAFAAGMAYGIAGGFFVCGTATLVGAQLAFLLTRSLFRPLIVQIMARRPRVGRLDEVVTRDGWRLVALMRLSPVMPFAATSFALGLTSLSVRQYMIGTLASLPALLGFVTMGHLARTGVSSWSDGRAGFVHWAALVVALGATALLTVRLARIVHFALRIPATSGHPVQVESVHVKQVQIEPAFPT